MLNRKGHVGTVMLVLVAFALVGTALYIYYTSNNSLGGTDKDLNGLIEGFEYNHKLVNAVFYLIVEEARVNALAKSELPFKLAFESELRALAQKRRDAWKDKTNLFGKLELEDVTKVDSGSYIVSVKGVFVKSKTGNNEITRTFDLEKRFSVSDSSAESLDDLG